jgi:translation initiation factor 2B subunit (eIF-2B alpha/beta/delta family)
VLQKTFKVIVLKQDLAKTRRLIKSLSAAGIDMEIVPEYSLSHYIEQGNKVFMGALSITDDMKVISAIGSANVVSLCHLNNLPVYLFANTLKFSHMPSSQQRIHRKVESKTHGDLSFQLITHSHDTVDLKHVDFLVTEDGIMDKAAISEFIKAPR